TVRLPILLGLSYTLDIILTVRLNDPLWTWECRRVKANGVWIHDNSLPIIVVVWLCSGWDMQLVLMCDVKVMEESDIMGFFCRIF
ncbi:hypothetical protein ACJMK2_002771, partial [Sinanodonta woodiana]